MLLPSNNRPFLLAKMLGNILNKCPPSSVPACAVASVSMCALPAAARTLTTWMAGQGVLGPGQGAGGAVAGGGGAGGDGHGRHHRRPHRRAMGDTTPTKSGAVRVPEPAVFRDTCHPSRPSLSQLSSSQWFRSTVFPVSDFRAARCAAREGAWRRWATASN